MLKDALKRVNHSLSEQLSDSVKIRLRRIEKSIIKLENQN